MKPSRLATAAMLVAVTTALTGCGSDADGGSSGFADKSVEDIVAETKKAMGELTALKVSGVTMTGGDRAKYDLQLAKDGSCIGTVDFGKLGKLEVLGTSDGRWFKLDAAFWKGFLGIDAEPSMDKWVLDETGAFAHYCAIEDFVDTLLDDKAKYESKGTEDVDGEDAVVVERDHPEEGVANSYVRVDDPHHLLQIEVMNEEAGTLTLSEFDEEFEVTAPSPDEVITMDELG